MIRVKSCVLAETFVENPTTGQLSAIGIVEAIRAPSFPTAVSRLAVLVILERGAADPARIRAEFSIEQGDTEIARQTVSVDFSGALLSRLHIRLNGFAAPAPGSIRFRVAPEGASPTDYVVEASLQEQEAGPQGAG